MAIERLDQINNKKDKELVELLQNLIRIRSDVPQEPLDARLTKNENGVVDFLEDWIKSNTKLSVERQKLEGGRFNLIASRGAPDVVFLGHTDTVAPDNFKYDQLAAEIHDGKIWGRGSADMKSGIATMIQAISLAENQENVWAMFYADEEYDFLGMKALVKDYKDLKPGLLVSSDGSNLSVGQGCRGLIEFRAQIQGVSAHAAKNAGVNAIQATYKTVTELRNYLDTFNHPVMGSTSMNLAYILGGKELKDGASFRSDGRLTEIEQEGNMVPNICEFVVDIRPSSVDLTADKIKEHVKEFIGRNNFTLKDFKVRHQLGAWYTDLSEIQKYVDICQEAIKANAVEIEKPGDSGYLDLQMLWEATNRPPAFMFGGGEGATAHKPDEHIKIENLIKERDFFKKVLEQHPR